jgi:hypothetical protein
MTSLSANRSLPSACPSDGCQSEPKDEIRLKAAPTDDELGASIAEVKIQKPTPSCDL